MGLAASSPSSGDAALPAAEVGALARVAGEAPLSFDDPAWVELLTFRDKLHFKSTGAFLRVTSRICEDMGASPELRVRGARGEEAEPRA